MRTLPWNTLALPPSNIRVSQLEVAQTDWSVVIHPDDLARVNSLLHEAVSQCKEVEAEIAHTPFRRPVSLGTGPYGSLRDATGKLTRGLVQASIFTIANSPSKRLERERTASVCRAARQPRNLFVWEEDPKTMRFTYVSDVSANACSATPATRG